MRHRFRALTWCWLLLGSVACSAAPTATRGAAGQFGAAPAANGGASGSRATANGGGAGSRAAANAGGTGVSASAGTSGAAGRANSAGTLAANGGTSAADGGRGGTAGGRTVPAGSGGASGANAGSTGLAPSEGALLGEYYGDGTIAETDARIGRKPTLHLVYYAWTDNWSAELSKDFSAGKIPLVNWEPDGIDFHDIVSGKLDSTIQARASGAKAAGAKFFLDFAAEMNADEAWSGNDPKLYVDAYHHMHDLFVAAGASNVVWAWCPNVTDTDGRNAMTMSYYPGDAYVDWSCVDGYNWGQGSGFAWQSFHDVFKDIYPLLAALGKPILIGEMASDEHGGDKAAWIDAIIPTLKSDYPMIKGLVWFDVKKERDWEINSSSASLTAYQRLAADAYSK